MIITENFRVSITDLKVFKKLFWGVGLLSKRFWWMFVIILMEAVYWFAFFIPSYPVGDRSMGGLVNAYMFASIFYGVLGIELGMFLAAIIVTWKKWNYFIWLLLTIPCTYLGMNLIGIIMPLFSGS